MDIQAQDRAHRIGQKKPVFVYRLITEHSVEEKILERCMRKLYLNAVVVRKGAVLEPKSAKQDKNSLRNMVTFGAEYSMLIGDYVHFQIHFEELSQLTFR